MFVIQQINNESSIQNLKDNISSHSYDLTFSFRPRRIGLYSKIYKNFIIIKDVSEEETHTNSTFISFYGFIFNNKYLIGIICPDILLTLLTLIVCITPHEYIAMKFLVLAFWTFVYLKDFQEVKYIRNKLFEWLGNE